MGKAVKILKQLSWQDWLETIFYPVVLMFRSPIAWGRSIWAARILLNGKWHRYMGFDPQNAINSFYYRNVWLNIDRYGCNGISPVLGLGSYPLSRWFHISMLSNYVYANAGAVTTLLGTLIWVFSHFVWLDGADPLWVLMITATLFLSTTSYAMAFARQNYNILGWMILPFALFAISSDQLVLAAFAWFAASLVSITVVFVAVPLTLTLAYIKGDINILWVLLPAVSKIALHFVPMLSGGGLGAGLRNMAKLIGASNSGVRYRRKTKRFDIVNLYFIGLYTFGAAVLGIRQEELPLLPLVAIAIFIVNQRYVRFADVESVIVVVLTVFAWQLMLTPPDIIDLAIFWLVASPIPLLFGISCPVSTGMAPVKLPIYSPFNHTHLESELERFFQEVSKGKRVLFAFSDPDGIYENVFDGYRQLIEPPLFVAAKKGVHLFPDWWAIAETNTEDAPQMFAMDVHGVEKNMSYWNAEYVIVYQESDRKLDEVWGDASFKVVGEFDWENVLDEGDIPFVKPQDKSLPKWWLLHKV
ncbi:hypothetical protein ACFL2V_11505 [Pseudomonadota bacterium]